MEYNELEFKKINIDKHSDIAIRFRADAFVVSFGSEKSFWKNFGSDGQGYIDRLRQKDTEKFGAFHIWKDNDIIGQIELDLFKTDETWGYVTFYYLKKEFRGKGYSKNLDDFAIIFFKRLGIKRARLSVSPNNKRAIKFYEKNGWIDKGSFFEGKKLYLDGNIIHLMEKVF